MPNETRDFPKRFDFAEAEPRLYERWLEAKAFRSAYASDGSVQDETRKDAETYVVALRAVDGE